MPEIEEGTPTTDGTYLRQYARSTVRYPVDGIAVRWKSGYPEALDGKNYFWWQAKILAQGASDGVTNTYEYSRSTLLLCDNGNAIDITDEAVEADPANLGGGGIDYLFQCGTWLHYEYSSYINPNLGVGDHTCDSYDGSVFAGPVQPPQHYPGYTDIPDRYECPWSSSSSSSQPFLEVEVRAMPSGVGTELKKFLASIGIDADEKGCECKSRAAEMDRRGADWCEANISTIVGWLAEEAKRRRLPFFDIAGRVIVRRAIKIARRNQGG